ncbi:MAG: carbohydrate ABC transporter permease [Clostridia bacterium]|nr:carbohydrate ABC transporter permease [Clostridia bacterium]
MKSSGKRNRRIFNIFNGTIMVVLMLIFILPFWMIVSASLTNNSILRAEGMSFLIKGFTFEAYSFLFSMSDLFVRSIFLTLFISSVTAFLSVVVCFLASFALCRKQLVGRKFFNIYLLIPMYFGGGMIPTYLIIRGIGIYDTIWAHILPGLTSMYFIMLLRNYFYGLPASLEEAARLDGAGDFSVLFHIFLPLSMPMLVTLFLMSFVGKWNDWMTSLLYFGATNQKYWTIQYVLQQIIMDTICDTCARKNRAVITRVNTFA